MKGLIVFPFLFAFTYALAQDADSTRLLDEIQVEGYLYRRPLSEAPASIGVVTEESLSRFSNTSFLPAVNTVPGVKMEERSPASYRLSIRGSSIRSPFGVRNVKVYRNGLPITDAGGNTYLNLFDFSAITNIEVIKGPGGSLYGAGTGGVLLLDSKPKASTGVELSTVAGSYGLQRYHLRGDIASKNVLANVSYAKQLYDGYRAQTAMHRDALSGDILFTLNPSTSISALIFYSDVFYETPGGLTKEQFDIDPRQARPSSGSLAGAEEQNASVSNKTGYTGVTFEKEWSDRWQTKLAGFASLTDFKNFAIANYEVRDEQNLGFRLENSYVIPKDEWRAKISFGAEFQNSASPIDVFENNGGAIGSLILSDDLSSQQSLLFGQAEIDLPSQLFITIGGSLNWLTYDFERTAPDVQNENKIFSPVFSPRVALLKKLKQLSLYGSISRGFSPPTLAEVRPSTNSFNSELDSETGTNFEIGARRTIGNFQADLTLYNFALDETIILQRVENGAEYFVNAGKTSQKGIELTSSFRPNRAVNLWTTFAYQHYRFKDYAKLDPYLNEEVDYSGNELTGVPPITAVIGIDLLSKSGLYGNVVYSYTDEIALNDLNDEFADDYFLLNVKFGYRRTFSEKYMIDVFAAADNALNEKYSLGNDLNARGRRFYNAAPRANLSVGLRFQIL